MTLVKEKLLVCNRLYIPILGFHWSPSPLRSSRNAPSHQRLLTRALHSFPFVTENQ